MHRNLLAMRAIVKGNLYNVFFPLFSSSDVRSERSRARKRRDVLGAAKGPHGARIKGTETTGDYIDQRFADIVI